MSSNTSIRFAYFELYVVHYIGRFTGALPGISSVSTITPSPLLLLEWIGPVIEGHAFPVTCVCLG